MLIISNKTELHNYLYDNYPGSIDEIKEKIDVQCNYAMENSNYPVKDLNYLCCRDVWELIDDEFFKRRKDVVLELSYDDCVDVINSI